MITKTTLFSPGVGDIVFPMTPTSLDEMALGLNTPVASLNNAGTSVLTGTVSGAGFNASVLSQIQGAAPAVRYLPITDVHSITGLPLLTATAATTLPGIARTAGTSAYLTGVATADTTPATTAMMWELDLPDTYVAASNIPVLINCVVPVATFVTAASTTMTVAAYSVSAAGVETALTVSAAQQIALTTASTLTFTITGTPLVRGSRIVLSLTALVTTTAGGASSVRVNSVGYTA